MRRYFILTRLAGIQELVYCQPHRDIEGDWLLRLETPFKKVLSFNSAERADHVRSSLCNADAIKILEVTEAEVGADDR